MHIGQSFLNSIAVEHLFQFIIDKKIKIHKVHVPIHILHLEYFPTSKTHIAQATLATPGLLQAI